MCHAYKIHTLWGHLLLYKRFIILIPPKNTWNKENSEQKRREECLAQICKGQAAANARSWTFRFGYLTQSINRFVVFLSLFDVLATSVYIYFFWWRKKRIEDHIYCHHFKRVLNRNEGDKKKKKNNRENDRKKWRSSEVINCRILAFSRTSRKSMRA